MDERPFQFVVFDPDYGRKRGIRESRRDAISPLIPSHVARASWTGHWSLTPCGFQWYHDGEWKVPEDFRQLNPQLVVITFYDVFVEGDDQHILLERVIQLLPDTIIVGCLPENGYPLSTEERAYLLERGVVAIFHWRDLRDDLIERARFSSYFR